MRVLVALLGVVLACVPRTRARPVLTPSLAVTTFDSAWMLINTTYFDSTFGGKNWLDVKTVLRPEAEAATSNDALRRVIRRMLDTLGGSHARLLPREELQRSGDNLLADPGIDVRPIAGGMLVVRVDSGSSAATAGVRPGWILRTTDERSVATLSRREVTTLLRGKSGTVVHAILDDLSGRTHELSFTRSVPVGILAITPNLPTRVVRFNASRIALQEGLTIGVIRFDQWLLPVVAALDAAIHELRDVDALIIDLRGNGGGLGSMVGAFAGYFVDTVTRIGRVRTRQASLDLIARPRRTSRSGPDTGPFLGPIVILVDRFTGSASEVFAGGLQSARRATVLGDTTAGAVLPSALDRLPNGDVLQHPISDFVTSSGMRLEGRGVWPDVPIIPRPHDYRNDEDPVLSAAVRWIQRDLSKPPEDTR